MTLGDHLGELRRILIVPIAVWGVLFVVFFHYQATLKVWYVWPLQRALMRFPQEDLAKIGWTEPIDSPRLLTVMDLSESAWNSVHLVMVAATLVAVPVFLWGLWRFVSVGLRDSERRLGVVLLPMGVFFFLAGAVLGYLWGIPIFMAWFIDWTVHDPITRNLEFRMSDYQSTFFSWTVMAGLIMLIPWFVMVLIRTGLVRAETLARYRRLVFMLVTIIAALVAPPDPLPMLAMMGPLYALFELGMILGRLVLWEHNRIKAREAAADARREAAETAGDAPQARRDARTNTQEDRPDG